jgi:hypothetical protein
MPNLPRSKTGEENNARASPEIQDFVAATAALAG